MGMSSQGPLHGFVCPPLWWITFSIPLRSKPKNSKRPEGVQKLGGAAEAAHTKRLKMLREESDSTTRAANEAYIAAMLRMARAPLSSPAALSRTQ